LILETRNYWKVWRFINRIGGGVRRPVPNDPAGAANSCCEANLGCLKTFK
jgi:hypothetical protein